MTSVLLRRGTSVFRYTEKMPVSSPVLFLIKQNGHYTLEANVGDKQVACVLLKEQVDGKTTQPIGYWSPTLTEQEKDLDTTPRKCLAVLWATTLLRLYL